MAGDGEARFTVAENEVGGNEQFSGYGGLIGDGSGGCGFGTT